MTSKLGVHKSWVIKYKVIKAHGPLETQTNLHRYSFQR